MTSLLSRIFNQRKDQQMGDDDDKTFHAPPVPRSEGEYWVFVRDGKTLRVQRHTDGRLQWIGPEAPKDGSGTVYEPHVLAWAPRGVMLEFRRPAAVGLERLGAGAADGLRRLATAESHRGGRYR